MQKHFGHDSNEAIDWTALSNAIDAFADVPNVHTIVGNGSGVLYAYSKGTTNGRTVMAVASATKWVGGVLVRSLNPLNPSTFILTPLLLSVFFLVCLSQLASY